LKQIFKQYVRLDVNFSTKEGSRKLLATQTLYLMAINALAKQPVCSPDRPSKKTAARALKWLLLEVPNNLPPDVASDAAEVVELMAGVGRKQNSRIGKLSSKHLARSVLISRHDSNQASIRVR
jgi:hypothetical protein